MDLGELMELYNEKVGALQERITTETQKIDGLIAEYSSLPDKYANQSQEWLERKKAQLQDKIAKQQEKLDAWIETQKQKVEDWLKTEQQKLTDKLTEKQK